MPRAVASGENTLMLGHLGVNVPHLPAAKRYYDMVMPRLGLTEFQFFHPLPRPQTTTRTPDTASACSTWPS